MVKRLLSFCKGVGKVLRARVRARPAGHGEEWDGFGAPVLVTGLGVLRGTRSFVIPQPKSDFRRRNSRFRRRNFNFHQRNSKFQRWNFKFLRHFHISVIGILISIDGIPVSVVGIANSVDAISNSVNGNCNSFGGFDPLGPPFEPKREGLNALL